MRKGNKKNEKFKGKRSDSKPFGNKKTSTFA